MKKKITYSAIAAAVVSVGTYITLAFSDGKAEGKTPNDQSIQGVKKTDYVVSDEELSKAAKSIGEVTDEQTLNYRMMEMLFQKITFNGDNLHIPHTRNPGRVQMTKENIQYLKNNLNVINNDERLKYESILNKWYDGNFESVVKDFKELRYLLWGEDNSTLKPVKKTDSDEKEYILHFFGQEGLDIHNKEWK